MNTSPPSEMVHPAGEDGPGFKLSTLGGLVTIERTDEALTPYGGLAAWSAFVQHLGTSGWPNAIPASGAVPMPPPWARCCIVSWLRS